MTTALNVLAADVRRRLVDALERHDHEDVRAAVDDLVERIRCGDVDTLAAGQAVAAALMSARRFDEAIRMCDVCLQFGAGSELWPFLAQGLLDNGNRMSADAVIASALSSTDVDDPVRPILLGLRGRSAKDAYLATREPDRLRIAIAAYLAALREGGDLLWLGVNALALAHHGRRHGIDCALDGAPTETELMAAAATAAGTDHWALATWIEAHLLVGLPVPVDAIVTRLADATSFVQGSLRSQLRNVWELPSEHPALCALAELVLRHGSSGEVEVPDEMGFETVFGPDNPMPLDAYRKGLDVARSVCLLTTGKSYPAGTGFLMQGSDLHPVLAGRAVLVTNEHVARRPDGDPGVRAEELVARFTAGAPAGGADGIGGFRGVWWSPSTELDVALLVSDQLDAAPVPPLLPASVLPMVRPGAHCYVVGHPGGGGLQLSIRGNELIDVDRTRLHYRTPTSRGSSGSPVLDQDWDLVGVHHRGADALPALNGKPGHYPGNEGTTIAALVAALADRAPVVGGGT